MGIKQITRKFRLHILERDEHVSQLRHYSEERGWHKGGYCRLGEEGKCPHLHIHHIYPQRQAVYEGWSEKQIHDPENLLTVASCVHVGKCPSGFIRDGLRGGRYTNKHFVIHPDIRQASMDYRGSRSTFKRVFKERDKKIRNGEIYWCDAHDVEMKETAIERSKFVK